jgi:kynurenine formamidase
VPAHHALLGAGRVIVENLTNVAAPSADRFTLSACPLAVAADGAPVRAVAVVD